LNEVKKYIPQLSSRNSSSKLSDSASSKSSPRTHETLYNFLKSLANHIHKPYSKHIINEILTAKKASLVTQRSNSLRASLNKNSRNNNNSHINHNSSKNLDHYELKIYNHIGKSKIETSTSGYTTIPIEKLRNYKSRGILLNKRRSETPRITQKFVDSKKISKIRPKTPIKLYSPRNLLSRKNRTASYLVKPAMKILSIYKQAIPTPEPEKQHKSNEKPNKWYKQKIIKDKNVIEHGFQINIKENDKRVPLYIQNIYSHDLKESVFKRYHNSKIVVEIPRMANIE